MNAAWIKHGLTRIGVWCALAGVTVLLTVLFSFLGNLTCAVLSGMILGAARRWRWNAIPISLLFPAVILALSSYSKLELPPGKVHLIALVCGVAFWGVYGMTYGLHFLERKQEVPTGGAVEKASRAAPKFHLAALCGRWTCEDTAADGSMRSKMLRIEQGKFELTVGEPGGRVRVIAQGEVSVDAPGSDHPAVIFHEERNSRGSR